MAAFAVLADAGDGLRLGADDAVDEVDLPTPEEPMNTAVTPSPR